MHVLITGGAGFIGSHLAEALLAAGQQVTAVDDLSTGRYENVAHLAGRADFQFVLETMANEVVMDRLVSECDLIYHLAAAVGVKLIVEQPVRTIETNILGTAMVLKLARRYRRKVLLASTSEIYGKSEDGPYREDGDRLLGPTTRSRWSYSDSKAVDEFLALAYHREYGIETVIPRLFNTIGPRQTGAYGMVVPRFVRQALRGEPLTVYDDGQMTRCFCNVRDVVRALTSLADCSAAVGEIFNVGSTEEIAMLDLARRVIARSGSASEIRFVPYAEAYESGFEDMRHRVPDIRKIQTVVGWEPRVSLDESLDEVIEYERQSLLGTGGGGEPRRA